MRVLTILGSPRPNGNTAHVLNWVEHQIRLEPHTAERITLIEHKIEPCRECDYCRSDDALCAQTGDDAPAIMRKMEQADCILLATPLFCWGYPSHMKALLDRMYSLVGDYDRNPEYTSRLAGKPMALLLTCGGAEEGNAELLIRGFYAMVRFLKAVPVGHLLYPFFRSTAELTSADRARAVQFALQISARS